MKNICVAFLLLLFTACQNDYVIRNSLYKKPETKQRVVMLPINIDSISIVHPDDFDAGFGGNWNEPTFIRLGKLLQSKLSGRIGLRVAESGDDFVMLPDSIANKEPNKTTHDYISTPTSKDIRNQKFVTFILPKRSYLDACRQKADIIVAINGIRVEPLSVSSLEYHNSNYTPPPAAPRIPKISIPTPRFKFQPLHAGDSTQSNRIRSIPYMKGVNDSATAKELRSGLKITGSFVVYSYSSPNPVSYGTIIYDVADKRHADWLKLLDTFCSKLADAAF